MGSADNIRRLFCSKTEHANIIIRCDGKQDEQGELSGSRYAEFWRACCDTAVKDAHSGIFQVPLEVMPVMIQLPTPCNSIDVIVSKVQKYLLDTFRFHEFSRNSVDCIVTSGRKTITLWFPYCRLQVTDFLDNDIPELEKLLHHTIMTDTYHSGVPVYGSGGEVFTAVHVDVEAEDDGEPLDDPVDALDPEAHSKIDQDVISTEILFRDIPPEQRLGQYWLPMILAVDYWNSVTHRRTLSDVEDLSVFETGRDYNLDAINSQNCELYEDDNNTEERYAMFISMWKPESILNPKYWRLIGAAFHTLCHGSENGINAWVLTLQNALTRTTKSSWLRGCKLQRLCSLAYDKFKTDQVDWRTLMQIAQKDSPARCRKWHNEWVHEAAEVSLDGTEEGFARILARMDCLRFFFTHTTEDRMVCYHFQRGRLVRDYGFIAVRLAITNRLRRLLNAIRFNVAKQSKDNVALSAKVDEASEHIRKAIRVVGSQRMKMNIVRALSERLNVPKMDSYIDSNPDLTLLSDGNVMVATANNLTIREGLVQDYLCKSFGSYYKPTMSWSHPDVRKVLDWYFMLWIDDDLVHMMRKFIASLLRGGQHDKKFYLFIGETGSNMKTAFQRAVCLMCGNKSVVVPANYLNTGRGKANDASPMEAQFDGASLVVLDEFEPDTYFMPGLVKSNTGGNPATARKLYQAPKEFEQTHKIVGIGNKPPLFKKEDALVDRVVYVPFLTQMVYKPPADPMQQITDRKFKRDPMFMDSLPQLRHAMLWIAVQDYESYCKEGMVEKAVMCERYTQEYWAALDPYRMFMDEFLSPDPGSNGVEVFRLCNRFSRWFAVNRRGASCPDRADIIKEFTKIYHDPVGGTWPDIKLKEYDTGTASNRR